MEGLRRGIEDQFADVKYAVFGCGHRDWTHTYQKIPILVDELLAKYGGHRLLERTAADSGSDEFFETVSIREYLFCFLSFLHTFSSITLYLNYGPHWVKYDNKLMAVHNHDNINRSMEKSSILTMKKETLFQSFSKKTSDRAFFKRKIHLALVK